MSTESTGTDDSSESMGASVLSTGTVTARLMGASRRKHSGPDERVRAPDV
jgi:hypothetical protein